MEELLLLVSGKVIDILVLEGEMVKIGDVIVMIDDGFGDVVLVVIKMEVLVSEVVEIFVVILV